MQNKVDQLNRIEHTLLDALNRWNQPLSGPFSHGSDEVDAYARVADALYQHPPLPPSIAEFKHLYERIHHLIQHPEEVPHPTPDAREALLNHFL